MSVLAFYFLHIFVLKNTVSLHKLILCLQFLSDIQNSVWQNFATLYNYLATFTSFLLFFNYKKTAIVSVTLLCFLYYKYIYLISKESHWRNTILCFPLGIIYSYYKNSIDSVIMKNDLYYYAILTLNFCCFSFWYNTDLQNEFNFNIMSLFFCLCFTLVTVKIKMQNYFIHLIGQYSFDIYLFQRIPMLIIKKYNLLAGHTTIIYFTCYIFTLIIALFSHKCFNILNNFICKKIDKYVALNKVIFTFHNS